MNLTSVKKKNHNPDTKGQILFDAAFRRSLEQSKSERQKTERRLPRVGCEEEAWGVGS